MSYGVSYTWDRQGNRFWLWREDRPREKGQWATPLEAEFIKALSLAAFNLGRVRVIAGEYDKADNDADYRRLKAIYEIASGEEPRECENK
jgi:hypothetical protein